MRLLQIRTLLGTLVTLGGIVVACTARTRTEPMVVGPQLGTSTASGPSDPNMPPPDATGVTEVSVPISSLRQGALPLPSATDLPMIDEAAPFELPPSVTAPSPTTETVAPIADAGVERLDAGVAAPVARSTGGVLDAGPR